MENLQFTQAMNRKSSARWACINVLQFCKTWYNTVWHKFLKKLCQFTPTSGVEDECSTKTLNNRNTWMHQEGNTQTNTKHRQTQRHKKSQPMGQTMHCTGQQRSTENTTQITYKRICKAGQARPTNRPNLIQNIANKSNRNLTYTLRKICPHNRYYVYRGYAREDPNNVHAPMK